MGDFMTDQLYFEPTFLSEALHSLPHMSLTLETVDDTFDPYSVQYLTSLVVIGSVPVALIMCGFCVLAIHVIQEMLSSKSNKQITQCHCKVQRLLRYITFLLIIMIILEVMVQISVLRSLPLTELPETPGMRDFHMYQVRKVDTICKKLDTGKVDFNVEYDAKHVQDMTAEYKRIAESIVNAGLHVRGQQLPPREMMMPFAQYVALFGWFRFIPFMIIWCVVLVICLMRLQSAEGVGGTSATCGVFALIFCAFMSIAIATVTVGLADACQDPAAGAAKLTPFHIKQEFLRYQYNRMCLAYRTVIYENLRIFQLAVLNARRQALRRIEVDLMVLNSEFNAFKTDVMWPRREKVIIPGYLYNTVYNRYDTYKDKLLYAQAIYKYLDNFYELMKNESWNDRLYCFDADDEVEEFIDFKDDARDLCRGDKVLIWLLLQMILLMVISAFFFNIVRIHIGNKRWD